MDPCLYRAAMEGKVDVLHKYVDQLVIQVTPNNNTVLHIAALFGNAQCVPEILRRNSSLLSRVNVKGDTPLHLAAREGHSDVVKTLIECAKALDYYGSVEVVESGSEITKEMLRMTNEDGDTALHDAVRYHHPDDFVRLLPFQPRAPPRPNPDVVRLLMEADPESTHSANSAGETPLYIAAERGYSEVVLGVLKTCIAPPAYGGPGGRTALHAAVICNNEESTKTLLDWKKDLAKEPDMYGWTPLHYAARFGHVLRAKQLLDSDKSIAYLTAHQDDNKTALHIAASQGHVGVIKELISQCPDCWEMINRKGQNILHVAVENKKKRVMKFILKNSFLGSLVNQKDVDGNTPLHLLGSTDLFATDLIDHPKVDKVAFNKENWTPLDVMIYSESTASMVKVYTKKALEEVGASLGLRNVISQDNDFLTNKTKACTEAKGLIPIDIRKARDTHLIVAALIATVTFAAGFTMLGGYNNNDGPNQGMAILTREAAFKAFAVSDVIAMILSTCVVLMHFASADYRDQDKLMYQYSLTSGLVMFATGAMVLAFIIGTYVLLPHSSRLAISVCVIGCMSYPIYYLLFREPVH